MAADTFSAILGFRLQGTGNNENTWGELLNDEVFQFAEDAIAGKSALSLNGGTTTLSAIEARSNTLLFTGTLVSGEEITIPNASKSWVVSNLTSGSFATTLKTASGAAATVPQGGWTLAWCDGSNVTYVAPLAITNTGITVGGTLGTTGALTLTTNSANAFAVGRLGATTPVLHVNASVASAITGISFVGRGTGAGVDINATGEANVDIRLTSLGTGGITLASTGTGFIALNEAVTASTTLGVTGATTLSSTLNLVGAGTFDSTLSVAGAVTFAGATFAHTVTNSISTGVVWTATHSKAAGVGDDADVIFNLDMFAEDSAGNNTNYARMESVIEDSLNTAEDGSVRWRVMSSGTLRSKLTLSGDLSALHPAGNTGVSALALGNGNFRWTDLFLDTGATINFNNGGVIITHNAADDRLDLSLGGFNVVGGDLTVGSGATDFVVSAGTGIVNCVGHYRVDGTQVVTNQQSAVANATGSGGGDAHTQLNLLLTRLRTHGLIDT